MRLLVFLIIFSFLSACESENEPYLVSGNITGLTGSLTIRNSNTLLIIKDNGEFEFPNKLEPNESYQLLIEAQPEGEVCAIENARGNRVTLNNLAVSVICIPNKLVVDAGENNQIEVDLAVLPSQLMERLVIERSSVLKNHGLAITTVSTVAGKFVNDFVENSYYGVTRSGDFLQLFKFNVSTESIDFSIPIQEAKGAWSMVQANDDLYIGTYNPALLYKFNMVTEQLTQVAELEGETYIWDMSLSQGNLYIGTYPSAKLFTYNIAHSTLNELVVNSQASTVKYTRAVVAHNNKLYLGYGTPAELLEYDISTGETVSIPLPDSLNSFVYQLQVHSDKLFVGLSPSTDVLAFDLNKKEWVASLKDLTNQPVVMPTFIEGVTHLELRGYLLEYWEDTNSLYRVSKDYGVAPHFTNENNIAFVNSNGLYYEKSYSGVPIKEVDFLSVGLNGIPARPYSLIANSDIVVVGERRLRVLDTKTNSESLKIIKGEPKGLTFLGDHLYSAVYTGAEIWRYPISDLKDVDLKSLVDDKYLFHSIGNNQNRPLSIDSSEIGNSIIIGTEPHYGLYGGAFTQLSADSSYNQTEVNLVSKHSISAVTYDRNNSNLAYIGTSAIGGTGTDPLAESAYIVKLELSSNSVIFASQLKSSTVKIKSIVSSEHGELYLLTSDGLIQSIDSENGDLNLESSLYRYRDIILSEDDSLYAIDDSNLYRLDKLTLKPRLVLSGFNNLEFLVEDPITKKVYFLNDFNLYSLF
ncbi:MAG: hypothetical protein GY787_29570 [Alteromonadales bacterium]|nr:hypothetical protein [Alteromonadales bacterium]